MDDAARLLTEAVSWLRDEYGSFAFYAERDVVWTLQLRLAEAIRAERLSLAVYNDFPMIPGLRRSLSADLAIVDSDRRPLAVLELKFEPGHRRPDILRSKLPVVFWGADGVAKDVARVKQFIDEGRVGYAASLFIDEGGYFSKRPAHPGSCWERWNGEVWALRSTAIG